MGIVKRSAYVEEYLDDLDVQWEPISDKEFKKIYKNINELIDNGSLKTFKVDVFEHLLTKLPITGYVISAPTKDHLLSIYNCGVDETTFGYRINVLQSLDRGALDKVPGAMVFTDDNITFVCRLNYSWREITDEIFLETNV